MDAKTFGAFLARVRREQGLTQAELAEQLHVTDKAVSRWERGIGLPDINTLEPLADALGLSLADLMHCHDPAQEPPTAPVPLEDFFSMLRRRPVADWHSVRTALLRLSIALALWGIFACHGTLAVHWRSLSDGSLQADGWMSSWVVFPLLAGMEFLMLELWNSFEQSGFYHRYLEACTLLDTPFLRLTRVILELLLFFGFGFLVPCAEITIMLFNCDKNQPRNDHHRSGAGCFLSFILPLQIRPRCPHRGPGWQG